MKEKFNKILEEIKRQKILITALLIFIGVIALIGVIAHEIQRREIVYKTYITIDEEKIPMLEYAYYYQTYKSEFMQENSSFISMIELKEGEILEDVIIDEQTNQTIGDFLNNQALQTLLEINFLYDLSVDADFETEDLKDKIKEKINTLENNATTKNLKLNEYLSSTFVEGTRKCDLKDIIEKNIIANEYKQIYKDSIEITDEEINQYYEDNKVDYDVVDYRIFSFSVYDEYTKVLNEKIEHAASNSDSSENSESENKNIEAQKEEKLKDTEEYKIAKENIYNKAMEFYNQVYDEETFKNLCIKYAQTDSAKTIYSENDYSLHTKEQYVTVESCIAEWLFNEERQPKATAVIYDESTYTYYVAYFIQRYKNETNFVSVKNIFIPFATTNEITFEISKEDKIKTKEEVDEILKEWEESSKKSADFDKLISKYNLATSAGVNGTFTNLTEEEMPKAIAEWSYALERKSGDITTISDENGYYIVYFDKTSAEQLTYIIENDIRDEKYVSLLQELIKTHSINLAK